MCQHILEATLAEALGHNAAGLPQSASQAAEVVMGSGLLDRVRQQRAADSTSAPAIAER